MKNPHLKNLVPLALSIMTAAAQTPSAAPVTEPIISDQVGAWIFIPLAVILLAVLFATIGTSESRSPHTEEDSQAKTDAREAEDAHGAHPHPR